MVVVQHSRPDIDDEVQAVRVREHPIFAVGAIELPMRTMQTTDHGLTTRHRKAVAWHNDSQ